MPPEKINSIQIPKIIPTPKPGNWQKSYGDWNGLCQAVHLSIGRKRGGGILKLSKSYLKPTAKPTA